MQSSYLIGLALLCAGLLASPARAENSRATRDDLQLLELCEALLDADVDPKVILRPLRTSSRIDGQLYALKLDRYALADLIRDYGHPPIEIEPRDGHRQLMIFVESPDFEWGFTVKLGLRERRNKLISIELGGAHSPNLRANLGEYRAIERSFGRFDFSKKAILDMDYRKLTLGDAAEAFDNLIAQPVAHDLWPEFSLRLGQSRWIPALQMFVRTNFENDRVHVYRLKPLDADRVTRFRLLTGEDMTVASEPVSPPTAGMFAGQSFRCERSVWRKILVEGGLTRENVITALETATMTFEEANRYDPDEPARIIVLTRTNNGKPMRLTLSRDQSQFRILNAYPISETRFAHDSVSCRPDEGRYLLTETSFARAEFEAEPLGDATGVGEDEGLDDEAISRARQRAKDRWKRRKNAFRVLTLFGRAPVLPADVWAGKVKLAPDVEAQIEAIGMSPAAVIRRLREVPRAPLALLSGEDGQEFGTYFSLKTPWDADFGVHARRAPNGVVTILRVAPVARVSAVNRSDFFSIHSSYDGVSLSVFAAHRAYATAVKPEEIADIARSPLGAPIKDPAYRDFVTRVGRSPDGRAFQLLCQAGKDGGTVVHHFDHIDEETMEKRLRAAGYTPTDINALATPIDGIFSGLPISFPTADRGHLVGQKLSLDDVEEILNAAQEVHSDLAIATSGERDDHVAVARGPRGRAYEILFRRVRDTVVLCRIFRITEQKYAGYLNLDPLAKAAE